MKNRKLKMIVPILTLMVGIGGAFATNAFDKVDAYATITGYVDSPLPCEQEVDCSDINNGILCTDESSGLQAFAKAEGATRCEQTAYQLIEP